MNRRHAAITLFVVIGNLCSAAGYEPSPTPPADLRSLDNAIHQGGLFDLVRNMPPEKQRRALEYFRSKKEWEKAYYGRFSNMPTYNPALLALGDDETRHEMVDEFRRTLGARGDFDTMAASGDPLLIEILASELYSEDLGRWDHSMRWPMAVSTGDLILAIITRSSAFSAEVTDWARTRYNLLNPQFVVVMRRWWEENKRHFATRDYQAVRPGLALPEAPVIAAPLAVPLTPSPPATTPLVQSSGINAERKAPVWPWLVGIAALIAILALFFKRRSQPPGR